MSCGIGRIQAWRGWTVGPPARFGLRLVVLLAVLCATLSSCAPPGGSAAGDSGTITFGLTIPITGERAAEGAYSRDGYQFYVDTVNRAGGITIGGRRYRIALRYYDDQSKPRLVAGLYKKLIVDDKVDF